MSDFIPISCLHTTYKVISMLLVGRLKGILASIISHSQSAFMHGHLLLENIFLAIEIVHGYSKKAIEPSAILKVDLRKAFDLVWCDFIISTLRAVNL